MFPARPWSSAVTCSVLLPDSTGSRIHLGIDFRIQFPCSALSGFCQSTWLCGRISHVFLRVVRPRFRGRSRVLFALGNLDSFYELLKSGSLASPRWLFGRIPHISYVKVIPDPGTL